jgi:dGTP triphosphohydrolase
MKRAELIIGKNYYMNDSANWRDKTWVDESYAKTADRIKTYKVTVIETQLKTDYEKSRRTRDVLIQNHRGEQKWVALNHIRCTFIEAVKILTNERRQLKGYNDPANRYARHLERKFLREQFQPALNKMLQEMKRVSGEYVSSWDKMESLDIKTIQIITQALSGIKTELKEVA